MVRGLKAACATLPEKPDVQPAGELLVQAGAAFSDAAGGASGALVGMFFMSTGQALTAQGDGPYGASAVVRALAAGLETLKQMGQADVGDKTMIDTLAPFVHALGNAAVSAAAGGAGVAAAWQQALPAAEEGAASTAHMVARKGRSSRLGERSRGHVDPGARSMLYMLQAFGDVLDKVCAG
ncbi:MAG: DAK2 domain-containing protein, partial [Caldilineaceae bacterium]|nr:DAK2 domain-containing protein [Caldilineaceae bacterium]